MEIAVDAAEGRLSLELDFHARFQSIRPRLLRVCATVVGWDDAEDLVQETYIRALDRLNQLRDPALLEAWLVRIALNESRSLRRSQARMRERLPGLVPAPEPQPSDPTLRALVDGLPGRERSSIVLHYGYGYRVREIAQLLGISTINARTILFRARRRLRAQLAELDR